MSLMLTNLEQLVQAWGFEKGILPNPDLMKQWDKSQEELNELMEALEENDREKVKDAIGDIMVTLVWPATAYNLSLVECFEHAYSVISKRTGKLVDGEFIKDE